MYQVIARKYRPQTFDDVVNQEHVKQTLRNALLQGRVGHGYIFSGQRGTGKTTMARIVAKALNCDQGPTPEPCLTCASCTEIAAGNSIDLMEIDAASNRRIDDIRELRENVRYRPARDRYKVFIIDEAHQITSDAFNALLKTLEEPPEWVVFILCTTEPHEFPATIVSRCQTFPFRTVELELVVKRMEWICGQEGVEADADALVTIALAGDGSIRDSLSTLDQAIACFGKKLEADPVRDLLGAIPAEITQTIVGALQEGKSDTMLEIVDRLFREGRNLQHFSAELTRYFRNLLVMKISGEATRLVATGDKEREQLGSCLQYFSEEDLMRYVNLLLDLYRDLQQASQPRLRLEVGLLKLVHAGQLESIERVLAGWGESQSSPPAGSPAGGLGESSSGVASATPPVGRKAANGPPSHVESGTSEHRDTLGDPRERGHEAANKTASADQARAVPLPPETRGEPGTGAAESSAGHRDARARALADPEVKKFHELFGGQVREVRNLKEYSS